MKTPGKSKIYVKIRNGDKVVETYVDTHEERKDLYDLVKEHIFGEDKKDKKIGFKEE
jgi:hypothetical protein